ncbi:benzoate 4-monooxygenase cytochrome p450 [Phlyctema vagabunda]|uniref:Benzoate 4-monooxygenase cytochrome p450 n=1 Tax=Phlyctema vagabunda TaxID=108571 RepID=A0ABR4PAE5_9HELO
MAVLIYGLVVLLASILYTIYTRLYLSPLARFPGPKLAALTGWYEFYYNIFPHGGQFIWELERMHRVYGPVVRINPYEIHVDGPEFYDELYAGGGKRRDKYPWFTRGGGSPHSAFETNEHDLHRVRRGAINPFFSKRSIVAIEPIIVTQVQNLCALLRARCASQQVLDLRVAFSSLTLDIISAYCFGDTWGCLQDEELAEMWKFTLDDIFEKANLIMHVPWLLDLINRLPDKWAGPVVRHHRNTKKHVSAVLRHEDGKDSASIEKGQHSIFHELRDSSELPQVEKTVDRLAAEGNILIGAGSETTAQVLAVLGFHLLDNPESLRKLREELDAVMPTGDEVVKWQDLEKLPYLAAVLNEGLRISSPVATRLPRIAPTEELRFGGWDIPAGTPISMSYYFIHLNESIFPSPKKFMPERWIDATAKGVRLDRFLVPFSKGSRNCVGLNLAWAELYLAAAIVFRKFDLELYETTNKDVEMVRDCFVGQPWKGSQGIRVKVVGERA